MPATSRDRRREELAQAAQRWARYLKQALDDAGMTAAELIDKSSGALDSGKVTHWTQADNKASAEGALVVARILGLDPVEALREASQDVLAEALAEAVEREYRARIADMDREIEARLARHGEPREAGEPAANGAVREPDTAG
jgi:hypothetical protein